MKKFTVFFTLLWVMCSILLGENSPSESPFQGDHPITVDSLHFDHSELFIDNVKSGEYPQLFETTYTLQVHERNLKFHELVYDESGRLRYAIIYLFCYSGNWGQKGAIHKATYRVVKR